jgi:uncharacterized protein (DUF302 family)
VARLVVRSSAVDVGTAVERCTTELRRRGIRIFEVFDHGAGARSAGLDLPPEVVAIFGDPSVGTRLMQVDTTIGIELPLRVLVWDQGGVAHVGFVDPMTWAGVYAITADHPALAGMRRLLDELVEYIAASRDTDP